MSLKLRLDTSRWSPVTVTRGAVPKLDQNGMQKVERKTGAPMNAVQVMVIDGEDGAEILNVTVVGEAPKVTPGQAVVLVGLEAIPWSTNGKSGVAFRAEAITPVQAQASGQTKAA